MAQRKYVERGRCKEKDCNGIMYYLERSSEPEDVRLDVKCEICGTEYMTTKAHRSKLYGPNSFLNQVHVRFALHKCGYETGVDSSILGQPEIDFEFCCKLPIENWKDYLIALRQLDTNTAHQYLGNLRAICNATVSQRLKAFYATHQKH